MPQMAYHHFENLKPAGTEVRPLPRGEETEVDPEQFQDPDNEVGLFAGTVYEQDDEEADRIYDEVDRNMDARRRVRRLVPSFLASPPYSPN